MRRLNRSGSSNTGGYKRRRRFGLKWLLLLLLGAAVFLVITPLLPTTARSKISGAQSEIASFVRNLTRTGKSTLSSDSNSTSSLGGQTAAAQSAPSTIASPNKQSDEAPTQNGAEPAVGAETPAKPTVSTPQVTGVRLNLSTDKIEVTYGGDDWRVLVNPQIRHAANGDTEVLIGVLWWVAHPCCRPVASPPVSTTAPVPIPPAQPSVAQTTSTPAKLTDWYQIMLDLINKDRSSAGLLPVVLGSNPAAQQHAEEMLKNSYLSHWGVDGLKPYMRYTLAGGINYEAENVSGIDGPLPPGNYSKISVPQELAETERGFMNSQGHRDNILNKWRKKVNLGIACDDNTCAVVQQFEGDYVEFTKRPFLEPANGAISIAGRLMGGFKFDGIDVRHDRPTHPLTFGQLGKTYAYTIGKPIAVIVEPPPPRSFYKEEFVTFSSIGEISPYDIDPNTPRPTSCVSSNFSICLRLSPPPQAIYLSQPVPLVVATTWDISDSGNFHIQAGLRQVIARNGPGVYTIMIWGSQGGEKVPLTKYSITVP